MRIIIDKDISQSQSAFVRDCKILDEILIENDLVDKAKRKKKKSVLFKVRFWKGIWYYWLELFGGHNA